MWDPTLTENTDTATANVFTSGLVYVPGGNDRINALQDEDSLTGSGTNPTLNATLGNANDNGDTTVTPKMAGIETVNVAFSGSGTMAVDELDLQDTSGIKAFNITRVSDGISTLVIDNAKGTMTTLSIANSEQPDQIIDIAYDDEELAGTADVASLTLDNVDVAQLIIDERGAAPSEGFETINMTVTNDSQLGRFTAEDLQTLNISGSGDLTIGATYAVNESTVTNREATGYTAGLTLVSGSLEAVNASKMTGNLTLHIGSEIAATKQGTTSGMINMTVTGGSGSDKFVLTDGATVNGTTTDTDIINGGGGTDTLVITGSSSVVAATTANLRSLENLEIRGGHDAGVAADPVSIDFDAFDADVASTFIRNEGHDDDATTNNAEVSASEVLSVSLRDMSETESDKITVAHGNTGNNGIANLAVSVTFKTASTDNSAVVAIVDDLGNQDPVFNFQLNGTSMEDVTIADNDSESNSIDLNTDATTAATQAGSTLTITGGTADKYLNFDTNTDGADDAAGVWVGYGYATTGEEESATDVTLTPDTAVDTVFIGATYDLAGVARHDFEIISAGTFVGDLVIRLGEVLRADQASSMSITTGTGNDTLIFDAQDIENAGFTSADTINAGTGTDTLVIDGDTSDLPGTPRIDHQESEWDNLTGIDVLRFASNNGIVNGGINVAFADGAYYAKIDDEFIAQSEAYTDNRLVIINNDGDLAQNTESDLVLDLRGLSQGSYVTFLGADAGAGAVGVKNSNRLVIDDVSANQNMRYDGGDSDVTANARGNINTLEVRNTANVSVSDLTNTKNFGVMEFTNDSTVDQTLTLTINSTSVGNLVDANHTAVAARTERLTVAAIDIGTVASILNIDARTVTGFHGLIVNGSDVGNDTVRIDANLGGAAHDIDLNGEGAAGGDRVNITGGSTVMTYDFNMTTGVFTVQSVVGAVTTTTTHGIDDVEYLDLTLLSTAAAAGTVVGTAGADTILGSAQADVIDGGDGVDSLVGGSGADVFLISDELDHDAGEVITAGAGADVIRFTDAAATAALTLRAGVTDSDGVITVEVSNAAGANTTTNDVDITAAALVGSLRVELIGNDGENDLVGTANADTISGGGDADNITGGAGADSLTGGAGADIFFFADDDSSATAVDEITDFTIADDELDFASAGVEIVENEAVVAVEGATTAVDNIDAGVTDGIITLDVTTDHTNIDTLEEWLAVAEIVVEAAEVGADNDVLIGFEFNGDTYVCEFSYDDSELDATLLNVVKLTGVDNIVEIGAAGPANTIVVG